MANQKNEAKEISLGDDFGAVAPVIGATDDKGRIYAGISMDRDSPRCGEELWVASKDAGIMTHVEAEEAAAKLRLQKGNVKIGLPTKDELSQIYNNLAEHNIGGFDRSGSYCAYFASNTWKAALYVGVNAAYQRFDNGVQGINDQYDHCSVRFVCSKPAPGA